MLDKLNEAEKILGKLLREEQWKSLDVDYHPPHVERLWIQAPSGNFRIYLHRIHPCKDGEALWHPHPWPSAVKIIEGTYKMGAGRQDWRGMTTPPVTTTIVGVAGSSYEMVDADAWHYVQPLEPVLSLMVTGRPWDAGELPRQVLGQPWPPDPLGPLSEEKVSALLSDFKKHYR